MICSKCNADLPDDEFAWKNRDRTRRSRQCKACVREYTNAHYRRNVERRKREISSSNKRRADAIRDRLRAIKTERGCADCGESDPIVLEFDHLRDKEFDISSGGRGVAWSRIEAEILKCDVVCANCHRRRTHTRRVSTTGSAPHL